MKPSTRYERFREAILAKFNEQHSQSRLITFLKTKENINNEIAYCCDENDALKDDAISMAHSYWQIFRLVNRPILLRDLEVFAAFTYPSFNTVSTRSAFYTAISVLHSINLIDYTFRELDGRPADVILFSIHEDELTTTEE
jgi:hypothetical protein